MQVPNTVKEELLDVLSGFSIIYAFSKYWMNLLFVLAKGKLCGHNVVPYFMVQCPWYVFADFECESMLPELNQVRFKGGLSSMLLWETENR